MIINVLLCRLYSIKYLLLLFVFCFNFIKKSDDTETNQYRILLIIEAIPYSAFPFLNDMTFHFHDIFFLVL